MPRTLYVGDLSSICSESDLYREFSSYGAVSHVHIQQNHGFVKMSNDQEALIAIEALNGMMLLGRRLIITRANSQKTRNFQQKHYSLYVKFESRVAGVSTNEVILRELFSRFADVDDVSVRKQILNTVRSVCVY